MSIFDKLKIDENIPDVELPSALIFSKGGKLTYNGWVYNDKTKEGKYISRDITDNLLWLHKRGLEVSFDPDVTLNDVFLFLERELEICDVIFENCYIKDYVTYWKNLDRSKIVTDHSYNPNGIEYLQLYWAPDLFTYAGKTKIYGLSSASLDGQGFILKEDVFEDDEKTYVIYKTGTRISYGIDFSAIETILDLPIKLNTNFKIVEECDGAKNPRELLTLLDCDRDFSFHEAIEAIMWELSFYGTEEDKMEKLTEIEKIKNSIEFNQ